MEGITWRVYHGGSIMEGIIWRALLRGYDMEGITWRAYFRVKREDIPSQNVNLHLL